MRKRRTPREKKELSYQHDHRDTYNESSKGSRKSVRFRKRWVNQVYRQRIRQALHGAELQPNGTADDVTNRVLEARRPNWKKSPHTPLGLVLFRKRKIDPENSSTLRSELLTRPRFTFSTHPTKVAASESCPPMTSSGWDSTPKRRSGCRSRFRRSGIISGVRYTAMSVKSC